MPRSTAPYLHVVWKDDIWAHQTISNFSIIPFICNNWLFLYSFFFFFAKYFWAPTTCQALFQVLKSGTQQCKTYTSIISTLGRSPALIFSHTVTSRVKIFMERRHQMWQMHSHSHMRDIPSFSITTLYLKRNGSEVIMNYIVFPNKRKCNFTLM